MPRHSAINAAMSASGEAMNATWVALSSTCWPAMESRLAAASDGSAAISAGVNTNATITTENATHARI